MADTLDVITLAEAKSAINIASSDTSQDTELAGYVTAVSRRLDTLCGPVVKRTISGEQHMVSRDLYIDVRYRPIYSVAAVYEFSTDGTALPLNNETTTVKPEDGFLIDPNTRERYRIFRRSSGLMYPFPYYGIVEVSYDAGRYADTASVDPVFKQGAAIMLAQLWRREQGIGTANFGLSDQAGTTIPTFAVPRAVLELLAEYLRPAGVA
jgi:hypothetical protein